MLGSLTGAMHRLEQPRDIQKAATKTHCFGPRQQPAMCLLSSGLYRRPWNSTRSAIWLAGSAATPRYRRSGIGAPRLTLP